MSVKHLAEHHLEFLSLKGGCTSLSESTLIKMSNGWKSHVAAQQVFTVRGLPRSYKREVTFVMFVQRSCS